MLCEIHNGCTDGSAEVGLYQMVTRWLVGGISPYTGWLVAWRPWHCTSLSQSTITLSHTHTHTHTHSNTHWRWSALWDGSHHSAGKERPRDANGVGARRERARRRAERISSLCPDCTGHMWMDLSRSRFDEVATSTRVRTSAQASRGHH
jgi:hypothetical protein